VYSTINEIEPFACPGLHEEHDLSVQSRDAGFWSSVQKLKNIESIHVGHDHGSSWCCKWAQKSLCLGRHSGYGGYGDEWEKGTRVLELYPNATWQSWVRLERDLLIVDRYFP
jgi:hypothetical protein